MSSVVDWLRRHRRYVRRVPAAIVALAMFVLLARNADIPDLPDYELPEGFEPAPPPTTALAGAVLPALPPVGGTTTSLVPPNVGRSRLTGVVTGPQGVVPGAIVRIERVVGDATQVVDAVTGVDGRYDVPGIGGGRYRLRAFLAPTLAQPTGSILYLPDGEERTVDLTVEAFAEPSIDIAVAPDPPLLDQQVNLGVRVSGRLVDVDGFVRTQPLVGGTVQVTATGGWSSPSPFTATTDGDGQARFSASCRSTSSTQLQVTVRVPNAVPGSLPTTATFDVAACVDPATLTTTTTSTVPDGSSTSSSDTTTTSEPTESTETTSTTTAG